MASPQTLSVQGAPSPAGRFGRSGSKQSASGSDDSYPGRKSGLFADAQDMKEQLRKQMLQPEYDVCNFYKEKGFCQLVARSGVFEQMTLYVIALNAIWIAVDTDHNHATQLLDAHPAFQIADHFFCVYFHWEWCMRFGAFASKWNCFKDSWFLFDSFLVVLMGMETWVLTVVLLVTGSANHSSLSNASILRLLRLLRLSRMARMAKLLRSMPELSILIKGLLAAMRSVLFTLMLLCLLIYVTAVAFRQLLGDTAAGIKFFPTMEDAMHTLLLEGCFMNDLAPLVKALQAEGVVFVFLFYSFLMLAAMTMLNMLIGVLCEVVSAVAQSEKEANSVSMVKEGVMSIIRNGELDVNGDELISKAEFEAILQNPQASKLLTRVDVDIYGLVDLSDFIFTQEHSDEDRQLTFAEFMDIVLSLRGSNQATVKEIVELRKFIKRSLTTVTDLVTARTDRLLQQPALQAPTRRPSDAAWDKPKLSLPTVSVKGHSNGHSNGSGGHVEGLKPGVPNGAAYGTKVESPVGSPKSLHMRSARSAVSRSASLEIQGHNLPGMTTGLQESIQESMDAHVIELEGDPKGVLRLNPLHPTDSKLGDVLAAEAAAHDESQSPACSSRNRSTSPLSTSGQRSPSRCRQVSGSLHPQDVQLRAARLEGILAPALMELTNFVEHVRPGVAPMMANGGGGGLRATAHAAGTQSVFGQLATLREVMACSVSQLQTLYAPTPYELSGASQQRLL
eukprot:TRINITY_DN27415_c0_g1_i1.p1 TRINITY_DN27415_c0_g1~~TRINITY_DN27415_c0_g1_i1.p1  ORF type:complete len:732 (+),score=158.64 TRINITY_DN27415_c0_g1_i1:134-2329(+)